MKIEIEIESYSIQEPATKTEGDILYITNSDETEDTLLTIFSNGELLSSIFVPTEDLEKAFKCLFGGKKDEQI